MSGIERERKFLVRRDMAWHTVAYTTQHLRQGYILAQGATVRVRTCDDRAYLTIKGKSADDGLSRYEFETEITLDEASALLALCRGGVVDKERRTVAYGGHLFEIDLFHGDSEGLVLAEVELKEGDSGDVALPPFLGPEVSGDRRFRSAFIAQHPFCEWRDDVPRAFQQGTP